MSRVKASLIASAVLLAGALAVFLSGLSTLPTRNICIEVGGCPYPENYGIVASLLVLAAVVVPAAFLWGHHR